MSKFVLKPNLSEKADIVLLGDRYRDKLDGALIKHGLRPIYVPDNPYVDERLSGHADLSVLHLGENRLVLAPFLKNSNFSKRINELGSEISFSDTQMRAYPFDSTLNICICGEVFFCNPKSVDRACVDILGMRGVEPLSVKQGYTKCAVCVVDESSIITSDRGIHTAAEKAGFASLLIKEGHIELEGFPYGFIGGSSFKISAGELAFTGSINDHPDAGIIFDFLESRGIEPVFLTDDTIFDVGSILPLTEK